MVAPRVAEAIRYLGADDTLRPQVECVMASLTSAVIPRWRWRVLEPDGIDLPGLTARTLLQECHLLCLLTATLGTPFDAMLRTWQARDMAQAVILDACGSALVEAACDEAEREISARFPELHRTDRFSPGYGDLPLSVQPDLCRLTDAQRALGVYVTPSCLLNPSKSVTAVIGLSEKPQQARIRGCAFCSLREHCSIRKGGKRCAL